MDMCVSKVMPGEEKSQRRAVEHSGNKLKEVLTILSVSIANTNPANDHQQAQTVLQRRVLSRTMLPRVRGERGTQDIGKSESELTKVTDTLQRVNLNNVVETLVAMIDVAVFSSVDRQKLLVIVQSRQSGDDDDSGLSVLGGAVSYHSQSSDTIKDDSSMR